MAGAVCAGTEAAPCMQRWEGGFAADVIYYWLVQMNRNRIRAVAFAAFYITVTWGMGMSRVMSGAESGCLHYDAAISGGQIRFFTDKREQAIYISGDFSLGVGPCIVKAQRAVVWIKSLDEGRMSRHDITVFAEDDVVLTEEGAVTTSDSTMLVKLRMRGRIGIDGGRKAEPSVKQAPFYRRAVSVRKSRNRKKQHIKTDMRRSGKEAADTKAATGPMGLEDLAEGRQVEEIAGRKPAQASDREEKPSVPDAKSVRRGDGGGKQDADRRKKVPDLYFHAAEGFVSQKDPDDTKRRIFISRGSIFLSQGVSESDDYMEMEADSAVVFSRKGAAEQGAAEGESEVPYAPRASGLGGTDEAVTGIYLQGDVRLRRGERKISAEKVYYDFVEKKALLMKPVMRAIQEQRNVPIIVRAEKARQLSEREIEFYDAKVSTSDFMTPTYHVGAKTARLTDSTPYDEEGDRLGERKWEADYRDATWNVRNIPVLFAPRGRGTFEEGHSPLRTARVGDYKDFGPGLQTEWHLFRLLGLVKPDDFNAILNADIYQKGGLLGVEGDYQRSRSGDSQYCGYFEAVGVYDREGEDDFGDLRQDIQSRTERGRILARHKEFLPGGWQIQGELSLISDSNFLEKYYRDEFWAGKEQENLIYAKKQRDNWAFTALLKARFNDFLGQTEAFPDVEGYLLGEPLFDDLFTYYGEARAGAVRYRDNDEFNPAVRSDMMARFDTRHEINMPLAFDTPAGLLNVVPFLSGRFTYWSDAPGMNDIAMLYNRPGYLNRGETLARLDPDDDRHARFYGQAGVRTNMHFWRIYDEVEDDFWDVHRLKHVVTPELVVFGGTTADVDPEELYPLSEDVETNIRDNSGIAFTVRNLLQTKRGIEGSRRTVDWMRIDATVGFFDETDPTLAGNGQLYALRPEYSRQRNFLNIDYYWAISNSVALLADANFDLDDDEEYDDDNSRLDIANIGLSVKHDPRLSYYMGLRYIDELNSTVGTFGLDYRINKKYTLSFFEQYDFDYRGGVNLGTRLWIVRKFPRWYAGLSFSYDARYESEDEIGVMLVLWPEGVPEARPGMGRLGNLLSNSDRN